MATKKAAFRLKNFPLDLASISGSNFPNKTRYKSKNRFFRHVLGITSISYPGAQPQTEVN
jgi:hypothetical protein